ncbi:MAG: hypothetical protein ABIB79_03025 [archaeon]
MGQIITHNYSDRGNTRRLQNILDAANDYSFIWTENPKILLIRDTQFKNRLKILSFRPQNIPDEMAVYSLGTYGQDKKSLLAFFVGGSYYDSSDSNKPHKAEEMFNVIQNTERDYVYEIIRDMTANFKSRLLGALKIYHELRINLDLDKANIEKILAQV